MSTTILPAPFGLGAILMGEILEYGLNGPSTRDFEIQSQTVTEQMAQDIKNRNLGSEPPTTCLIHPGEDVHPGWTLLEWSGPTHNWKSPASPTFVKAIEHWKIHPDSQKDPSKEKVSDLINKKYFILDLWSLHNQKEVRLTNNTVKVWLLFLWGHFITLINVIRSRKWIDIDNPY